MIRFIDLRGQGIHSRIAFFDTITDRFIEAEGEQTWNTFSEFEEACDNAKRVERCRRLCPQWAFNKPLEEADDMTREPRLVEVFEMVRSEKDRSVWEKVSTRESSGLARFHQWGVNYEEFETGPGNFTVAIVEYQNGEVGSIPAEMIKFVGSGA